MVKENEICPHCKKGTLVKVDADEPWHDVYLICPKCDSTYNVTDDEKGKRI